MADKNKAPMSQEKKHKIGNILAVLTVVLSILVPLGFLGGTEVLFWFLIVVNFLFGPCCFIAYLMEVKRGVFAYNSDEE